MKAILLDIATLLLMGATFVLFWTILSILTWEY